jgi:hypothetical protein
VIFSYENLRLRRVVEVSSSGLVVEVRFERHDTDDGVFYAPVFVPQVESVNLERSVVGNGDGPTANVRGMGPP